MKKRSKEKTSGQENEDYKLAKKIVEEKKKDDRAFMRTLLTFAVLPGILLVLANSGVSLWNPYVALFILLGLIIITVVVGVGR